VSTGAGNLQQRTHRGRIAPPAPVFARLKIPG